MKSLRQLAAIALVVALGVFHVGTVEAQSRFGAPAPRQPQPGARTPAQTRNALRATGIPHETTASGKVLFKPQKQAHFEALSAVSATRSGILHLFQDGDRTKIHFNGEGFHFVRKPGTNNWRLQPWTGKVVRNPRLDNGRTAATFIQLSPAEAANLRARIAGALAEQGPEWSAGSAWQSGHVATSLGGRPEGSTAAWAEMKIGANGESLAELLGVPSSNHAGHLQKWLETSKSDKIVGIGAFGRP